MERTNNYEIEARVELPVMTRDTFDPSVLDNYVQKSQTEGLLKNDGTVDTNEYLTEHQSLDNYVEKSQTSGLLKNDGTVDTNEYLTEHQSLDNYVEKSQTSGLLKNDGTVDTNEYLTEHQSLDNYVEKSQTSGLLKNDGTVDTNEYLTEHQSLDNYVQKSQTSGLLKNDGTVDTNEYLTEHQSLDNYVEKSQTSGLLKNDGSVDTNEYLTEHQSLDNYVQKDGNKQLSTEDFTTAQLNKLNGIESGAQVNVKPNWNAISGSSAEILNKPTINDNFFINIPGTVLLGNPIQLNTSIDDIMQAKNNNKKLILNITDGTNDFQISDYTYIGGNQTASIVIPDGQGGTTTLNLEKLLVFTCTMELFSTGFVKISIYKNPNDNHTYAYYKMNVPQSLDNYVQKSQTSGLLKNDGTVDTNEYLTAHQSISGKADKVANATNGHFAGLDANGNLTDSGCNASSFASATHSHTAADITGLPSSNNKSMVLAYYSNGISSTLKKLTLNVDNAEYIYDSDSHSSNVKDSLMSLVRDKISEGYGLTVKFINSNNNNLEYISSAYFLYVAMTSSNKFSVLYDYSYSSSTLRGKVDISYSYDANHTNLLLSQV